MMKTLLRIVAALFTGTIACSDGPGAPDNSSPTVTGFLDAVEIYVDQREAFTLSELFTDPDGDVLTHSAISDDPVNLSAEIEGDSLAVLQGLGATETIVTLTASDPSGEQASLSIDVRVLGIIQDDFDTDEGWVGMIVLDQDESVYSIRDGHLVMSPNRTLSLQYAWRDIGDQSFGPNWKMEIRVRADAPCYGFMAFSEEFRPPTIPEYVWSFDVDPFGAYLATLSVNGEWQYLSEAYLPPEPGEPDGYLEMAMGVTEDSVFYGYAHGTFKLFEFDLKDVPDHFGLNPKMTIEHVAVTTGTLQCFGYIWYDWIRLTINEEDVR